MQIFRKFRHPIFFFFFSQDILLVTDFFWRNKKKCPLRNTIPIRNQPEKNWPKVGLSDTNYEIPYKKIVLRDYVFPTQKLGVGYSFPLRNVLSLALKYSLLLSSLVSRLSGLWLWMTSATGNSCSIPVQGGSRVPPGARHLFSFFYPKGPLHPLT